MKKLLSKFLALALIVPVLAMGQTVQFKSSNVSITGGSISGTTSDQATYAALRAYSGPVQRVNITTQGIAGTFLYDSSDTTSADNAGTIIVASDGKRWKRVYSGAVNVLWFGAVGSGSTDNLSIINSVISLVNAAGGGEVYIPAGTYTVSNTITMLPNVRLYGAGPISTILKSSHANDGIAMLSTINSAVDVNVSIENLQLWNTNASNTGAGYDDIGGTLWNMDNVKIIGFKFGVILDQSEIVSIRRLFAYYQVNSGAGVWIVNGPDHTALAATGYSNAITIRESEFHEPPTVACIADDGAATHVFTSNTYEGGSVGIRFSQVAATVSNSYFEYAIGPEISFNNTSFIGTSLTYPAVALITGNSFSPTDTYSAIAVNSAVYALTSTGNNYNNSSSAAQIALGSSLVSSFIQSGDIANGGTATSGAATRATIDNVSGSAITGPLSVSATMTSGAIVTSATANSIRFGVGLSTTGTTLSSTAGVAGGYNGSFLDNNGSTTAQLQVSQPSWRFAFNSGSADWPGVADQYTIGRVAAGGTYSTPTVLYKLSSGGNGTFTGTVTSGAITSTGASSFGSIVATSSLQSTTLKTTTLGNSIVFGAGSATQGTTLSSTAGVAGGFNGSFLDNNGSTTAQFQTSQSSWRYAFNSSTADWPAVADQFTIGRVAAGGTYSTPTVLYKLSSAGSGTFTGTVASTGVLDSGNRLMFSSTAPTISSGFGTSPAITAFNTAAFKIAVGSSPGGTGVITLPTATTGWSCSGYDVTSNSTIVLGVTAQTTTSVSVAAYSRTTGLAGNFTASDVLTFQCVAF